MCSTKEKTTTLARSNLSITILLGIFIVSFLESLRTIEVEPVIEFMPITLMAVTLLGTGLLILINGIKKTDLKTPYLICLFIFITICIISTIYSENTTLTLQRTLQFIAITTCIYYITTSFENLERTYIIISKLTIVFFAISSIYVLAINWLGAVEVHNSIELKSIKFYAIEFSQLNNKRASSFFGNPNPFGIRLMIGILLCLYLISKNGNKILYSTLILLFTYALILSGSRASIIGTLIGVYAFLNITYIKDNSAASAIRAIILLGIISVVMLVISNPDMVRHAFSLVGRDSAALSGREIAWYALFDQIKETPLFGIGYRVSTEAILQKQKVDIINSHNLYLTVLSEVGIVGFILFSTLFVIPLLKGYMAWKKGSKDSFNAILIAMLLAILTNQFFEDMFAPLTYIFIWTFFNSAALNKYNYKKTKTDLLN